MSSRVNETTVYRSSHPAVLAAWEDVERAGAHYSEKVRALRALFPDHAVMVTGRSSINERVVGLHGTDSPGEAWRRQASGTWVPRRNCAEGKVMYARLSQLRRDVPKLPGMPWEIIDWSSGMSSYVPGVRLMEGALWAEWSATAEQVERSADLTLWERARLSEFYAAVESQNEVALEGRAVPS